MKKVLLSGIAVLTLGLIAACGNGQEEVTLNPNKDNTLYERRDGSRSNGSGDWLFVGATNGLTLRRTLLAFDVASAIPSGATITGVTLTMNMSRTMAGPEVVSIHKVLADWGEGASEANDQGGQGADSTQGDATWLHRFYPDQLWASQGGDFQAEPNTSTSINDVGGVTWESTDQLVEDVQSWLDDPSMNYGWILIGNEGAQRTTKRFDSKENPDGGAVLTIQFSEQK